MLAWLFVTLGPILLKRFGTLFHVNNAAGAVITELHVMQLELKLKKPELKP